MSKKALLGVVLPFISNPVVLAAVGIGAVGYTVYELFSNKEEAQDNGSEAVLDGSIPFGEPLNKPLDGEGLTAHSTVNEPLETVEATVDETVNPSVEEPHISSFWGDLSDEPQQDKPDSEEAYKKEMIRQAMSELGKRSAAARKKRGKSYK